MIKRSLLVILALGLITAFMLPMLPSLPVDAVVNLPETIITKQSYVPGQEITELRDQYSRTVAGENGNFILTSYSGSIHYRDTTGNFQLIDTTIILSDIPTWDWQVITGHWQLLIKNDTTISVRKDGNWVATRLYGIAYLDITTKDYTILQTTNLVTPEVSGNEIRWNDILYGVDYVLRYTNDSLKEDIIIKQVARYFLNSPGHRPSDYGYEDVNTYLVPIFETDWSSSLPMRLKSGVVVDPDGAEYEEAIYFESPVKDEYFDTNLVSFFPLDYVVSVNPINPEDPEEEWEYASERIRKRLVKKGGKHWLLIGARVTALNQMPEGSIIFDPTETLRPDATGDEENLEYATSGVGNHHLDVDEAVADEGTTYVEARNNGWVRDLYNLPASSGSGVINFIKVYARCYANWSEPRTSLKIAIKTGGTPYESGEITISSSWVTRSNQWNLNPGGGAWTWAQIDALQIGIAMRDANTDPIRRSQCTQVYVEIDYTPAPDPPTNLVATDGVHTNKVVLTWTKPAGAITGNKIYEGVNLIDTIGDVETYDDTGAAAGVITPGTASATDGGSTAHITLSLAGESVADGASRTYKVIAYNGAGDSGASNTDAGYRTTGGITYQWQRSAADGDGGYGIIGGATTDPYNDTAAPAGIISNNGVVTASDGSSTAHVTLSLAGEATTTGAGRWYYCEVSATGATIQDSTHNRGYRGVGAITYQWQRSAADSDASYGNIGGATTDPYNDTGAPSDGSGRYFQCIVSSTGASNSPQTSDNNRGFRSSVPTVVTNAATSIEETTATLSGNITSLGGGADVDERGFEWDIDTGAPYTDNWTESGSYGLGVYTHGITSLTKGELYFYRAIARNDEVGWGTGAEVTFLTKPDPPFGFSASVGGSGNITLVWSKGQGADNTTIVAKLGSYPANRADGATIYADTGTSVNHTGLTGGDTWYYRAWSYATEGGKEQYSDDYDESSSLAIEYPSVTTNSAVNIGTTKVTLSGAITSVGGATLDFRGFVWDTTSRGDPGNTAPAGSDYTDYNVEGGSFGTGAFTHYVDDLTAGTDYFYRACGHNSVGWAYGGEISFSTINMTLWFQPNTIISGTTLPDRAGNNDGTIYWGANPAGVTVILGSMASVAQPALGEAEDRPTADISPDVEVSDWFVEPDVSGTLLTNPIRPLVTMLSDNTTLTEIQSWRLLALAFILLTTVGTIAGTRGEHLGIASIVCGAVTGGAVALTIYPFWALAFTVGMVIGGLISERSPSL